MKSVSALRLGIGMVDLLVPGIGGRLVPGGRIDPRARRIVQVLGVRQTSQALLCSDNASSTVWLLGVQADVTHALSMALLAITSRRWRPLALIDASVAGSLAALGYRMACLTAPSSAASTQTGAGRLRNRGAERVAGVVIRSRLALPRLRTVPS